MSRRWLARRRAVQLLVLALYAGLPFAGAAALAGTLAALKLGPVDLLEPAGALSAALAARGGTRALLLGALPVALLAVALGPVFCSWACPWGLVSELVDRLRAGRRARWAGEPWRRAARPRRLVLAALLAGSLALGVPLAAVLSPPRLATALPLELRALAGAVPALTAALLAGLLAVELLGPRRLVCRVLCPAGTLAALLRTRRTLAPRPVPGRCGARCAARAPCFHACPWGVDPRAMGPGDGCTTCLACVDRCPSGALVTALRPPPPGRAAPAPPPAAAATGSTSRR